MVTYEEWIEKPFSKANHEPESAINLAALYWQGLGPAFDRPQMRLSLKVPTAVIVILLEDTVAYWKTSDINFLIISASEIPSPYRVFRFYIYGP